MHGGLLRRATGPDVPPSRPLTSEAILCYSLEQVKSNLAECRSEREEKGGSGKRVEHPLAGRRSPNAWRHDDPRRSLDRGRAPSRPPRPRLGAATRAQERRRALQSGTSGKGLRKVGPSLRQPGENSKTPGVRAEAFAARLDVSSQATADEVSGSHREILVCVGHPYVRGLPARLWSSGVRNRRRSCSMACRLAVRRTAASGRRADAG